MEEELDKNEDENSEQKGIRVDTEKTYNLFGRVIKVAPSKDIKDITGKDKIDPEDVALVVQANGKEEEEKDKEKSKFKAKYLIPIVIPLLLLTMAKSCSGNDKGPVIEYENVPIDVIVYNMDNPGVLTYNDNQVKAQEGMTSNGIEGNAYDGAYYNYQEQSKIENETSAEAIRVEEIKPLINGYMNTLVDENSTKEQKYEAAKKILEIYKSVEQIYIENQPDVEQFAEETIEALEAYLDENTEAEKKVVEYNIKEFFAEFGLTESNIKVFEEIVALMEAGYDITVEYEKELDGDYQITGEAVKEVVKDQEPGKLKTTWNKIVDFVKGRSDKEIEK